MDNEKITSDPGSHAKPPTSAESTLAPERSVIGGTLEGVSTASALLSRGLEEYRQGNFEGAETTLLKLLKIVKKSTSRSAEEDLDPQQRMLLVASAETALGRTYMQLGRDDEARANFSKAVKLFDQFVQSEQTKSSQVYSDYGIALFMEGRIDDAIENLRAAHNLGSKTAETYLYLGVGLKQKGDYKAAEHYLKEAVDASPVDPFVHEQLGEALKLQGADQYRDAGRSYYTAAYAAASAGQLERALDDSNQSLELYPDNSLIFALRGELLRLLNRNEEALEAVDQALRLEASDLKEQLFTTQAGALQALGRFQEALQAADQALTENNINATALGIKGQALHELNQHQPAIEFLEHAVALDSTMDWAYAELGSVHYDLHRYEQAIEPLDAALRLNPKNVWALYIKAETLRNLNDYPSALDAVNQALTIKPANPALWGSKADILRAMGKLEEALTAVDEALSLARSALGLATRGEILFALGRKEDAIKAFQSSLEIDANQFWVHAELGNAYADVGNPDEALAEFDKAMQLSPRDPWTLRAKGRVLAAQNRHEEAIPMFKQATESDPNSPWAYNELAVSLIAVGKTSEALDVMDRGVSVALEQSPDDPAILFVQGQVLKALGRYDQAVEVLKRCISLQEDQDAAHAELGNVLMEIDKYDEALQELDKALRINEKNASALKDKARLVLWKGDAESAISLLQRAAQIDSSLEETFFALADAYRSVNRNDEALKALEVGLNLDPENPSGLLMKGEVLHNLGQDEGAVKALEEAIRVEPEFAKAHVELAARLYDLDRLEDARAHLDKALETDPENFYALGMKAEVLRSLGSLEDASQTIEQALKGAPDEAALLQVQAEVLDGLEKYDEAFKSIEAVLLKEPENFAAQLLKGKILNGLEKHDEALATFEVILQKDPENTTALHQSGIAQFALNRNDLAVEAFDQVLKIEPRNTTVMVSAAYTLLFDDKYNQEKLDKGLTYLDRALGLEKEYAWALSIKGTTLCDLADYREAADLLEQATQFDKEDVDSFTYLGWTLECQGALLIQEAWEEQVTADPSAITTLSFTDLVRKSNCVDLLNRAERAYRTATEINKESPNSWSQKGVANIRYLLGDKEAAEALYRQILKQAENLGDLDPSSLLLLTWCHLRLGNSGEALKLFVDNQSLIGDEAEVQLDLGLALMCSKQYSPGLGQYERGIALAAERPARRCRGLLAVSRADLVETVIADPEMWASQDVQSAYRLLKDREAQPATAA